MNNYATSAESKTPLNPGWLTNEEAAELMGLTPGTLRSYRTPGHRRSPSFYRTQSGTVYYKRSDVMAWCDSRRASSENRKGRG